MHRKLEQLLTAVAVVLVGACTIIIQGRRSSDVPLGELLHASGTTDGMRGRAPDDPRTQAFVVFRAADCESRLEFLALFDRAEISSRVELRQLLLLGTGAEEARVRRQFGWRTPAYPIVRADDRLRHALVRLGATSTPVLVLIGADDAVRFISPGPRTPGEHVRLARALAVLDAG